jgi:hypothetical protein
VIFSGSDLQALFRIWPKPLNLPDDTQRIVIIGRTGSGKTVIAVWHFSNANWDQMPWIVYDFKRDSLIGQISELPGVEIIGMDTVPRKPGIYIVQPHPDDVPQVTAQMAGIWQQQNTGVFVDEGYMVCGPANPNKWFRTLLTQGRSLHIPMIVLTQRPVWLDRFVFSEADFYQVLALNHSGDRAKINEYIPHNISRKLPKYHSYYHDVAEGETMIVKPVPTGDEILEVFRSRLERMHKKRRVVAI